MTSIGVNTFYSADIFFKNIYIYIVYNKYILMIDFILMKDSMVISDMFYESSVVVYTTVKQFFNNFLLIF